MNLELHVIQNVAPANLNRDDTGAPKDVVFGGHRRARVSSQAWKSAVRRSFATSFSDDELAWRTKRLADEVADRLETAGKDREVALRVAKAVLAAGGASLEENGRTKVLWLVARRAIETLTKLCDEHWATLSAEEALSHADAKRLKEALTTDVVGAKAVDIALFGRMLTDAPEGGRVDAAAQVAHALSTHAVDTEFDYFTAVDDLSGEEPGAGMLGTIEFNSACFYRYACLDARQLVENLDGDLELARRAARSFATSFVTVMPTGKQNTFAAHNPPAAAVFVARSAGSWNLANAFVDPVWARRDTDLVRGSCERLADHWAELVAMYGNPSNTLGVAALPSLAECFTTFEGAVRGSLDNVASSAVDALFPTES
jgi:CRISPR system Cascade subunit CasC